MSKESKSNLSILEEMLKDFHNFIDLPKESPFYLNNKYTNNNKIDFLEKLTFLTENLTK